MNRFRKVYKLVEFNCGSAREIQFDTRDEPDDNHPENKAHANVYYVGKPEERKGKARRMAERCTIVPIDDLNITA